MREPGIPGTINGVSDAACSTIAANTALASVRMAHAWVRVTIPGSAIKGCAGLDQCYFDPSYKAYSWKAGIPLATAMGLVAGQPLQHATTGGGYSSGMAGLDPLNKDVPYVKSLNVEALNGDMQSYTAYQHFRVKQHGVIYPISTVMQQNISVTNGVIDISDVAYVP